AWNSRIRCASASSRTSTASTSCRSKASDLSGLPRALRWHDGAHARLSFLATLAHSALMSVLQWIGAGLLVIAFGFGPFFYFGPVSFVVAFLGALAGLALLFAGPKFKIWGPAVNDPHAVGGALPGGAPASH